MATYTLINSYTVPSGGVATVSFSSIPSNYTDLSIRVSSRASNTNVVFNNVLMSFNGSSSTFSGKRMFSDGVNNPVGSYNALSGLAGLGNSNSTTANTFSNHEIYISNYASNLNKSYTVTSGNETNAAQAYAELIGNQWSTTTPINSITFSIESSHTILQHSTFYLYGIKKS
jgi:hypothetical protein